MAWSRINDAAIAVVIAATLLICSASILAMSLGDPESMALVAGLGIVVTLLALAIISLNGRSTDTPCGMDGPSRSVQAPPLRRVR